MLVQHPFDDLAFGLDLSSGAVDLNEKDGFGVEGEAGVEDGFDGGDGLFVDHLQRCRDDALFDDGADGGAGLAHRIVDPEQRLHGLGTGDEPHQDLGDDADRAFAADNAADEVVTGDVTGGAADPADGAVGGDQFQPQDVVGRGAVGEGMGAARVLGDVAADGAGALAAGVRSVGEPMRSGGVAEVEVDDAWLDERGAVFDIDVEDGAHAIHADDDATLRRQGAAAEAGSRPARGDWEVVRAGNEDGFGHLLGVEREGDGIGPGAVGGAVILVDEQVLGAPDDGIGAEGLLKVTDDGRCTHHGRAFLVGRVRPAHAERV